MKQDTNMNIGQKGFTAALLVISMMAGTAMGTYVVYQVAHNKAGVLSQYINHEKYSRTNLYSLYHDNKVKFKAMVAGCQAQTGVKAGLPAGVCRDVVFVNQQLLGNYS